MKNPRPVLVALTLPVTVRVVWSDLRVAGVNLHDPAFMENYVSAEERRQKTEERRHLQNREYECRHDEHEKL